MDFLPKDIEDYAEKITTPEDEVLHQLARETNMKVLRARMLSGKLQGKLLQLISQMIKPERILEIGTYTGYSAICLARGLRDNGKLHTIDHNPELEDITRKYFRKAGLDNQIILHIGKAIEVLPNLNDSFDLAFIDADKENYVNYYELTIEKLVKGGIIIADNALWSGKVLNKPDKKDTETVGIIEFNNHVANDPRTENLLLPFRDGLMIIRKK